MHWHLSFLSSRSRLLTLSALLRCSMRSLPLLQAAETQAEKDARLRAENKRKRDAEREQMQAVWAATAKEMNWKNVQVRPDSCVLL